ncbi:hypothetical protein DWB85_03065 [Seongchinamella sediminis]|uniref:Uncharacterized protein n=1 Tax=Seongchinamella sediminis TaxID=2283635 RepID=A0A3L7E223_9GAMM|nr:hypothetical protein [Seongchinamella sediminis]RLQ23546.1 hypothetical protein DWB85_03065 [Seongchinamella sediminis]
MGSNVKAHLKHEMLVGGISNAIANGLIAWLILRGGPDLTWSGQHSFVGDIVATAFLLPLIVALIVIPLQRRKLKSGKLQSMRLESGSLLQSLADRFPAGLGKSSLLFGLVGVSVFAPVLLLIIYAGGIDSFSPASYAALKGAWAGLMAAVLVVIMVLVALRAPAAVAIAD